MTTPRRVLVTGAAGNLGRKLVPALLGAGWDVVAVDHAFSPDAVPGDARVAPLALDLAIASDALRVALAGVGAVVHLAARTPMPGASWAEACTSFDMTAHLLAAAAACGNDVRVVFASSNHVMGGYKEDAVATVPGALAVDLPPRPGTRVRGRNGFEAPTAYATAKLRGERLCTATAAASRVTAVSLRIGWCQPGDNHPATLVAAGVPGGDEVPEDAGTRHDLAWFRNMWLSNRDFTGTVLAALTADASVWSARAVVVNAMSNNANTPWDLEPTRALLGYAPRDDAWQVLADAG